MTSMPQRKLIADIGGTNVRFGITGDDGQIRDIKVLSCNDYPTLADAAKSYLDATGGKPDTGAFAVASPVDGTDRVAMTNHVWDFSINETRKSIGLKTLRVINDFAALAWSVPALDIKDTYRVGGGLAQKNAPIGIIGPGTGLGVAAVVFGADGRPVPIATEGGHVTMPATTPREFALFDWLIKNKYHHVSAERVVSGKGLVNLVNAICGVDGLTLPEKTPAEITEAGLNKSCRVCAEALDLFCHFLGVAAGNLALTYGAHGGIYIAGGIVPQLGDYFKNSRFRASFLAKGRYHDYMDRIPTFVINPSLSGAGGPEATGLVLAAQHRLVGLELAFLDGRLEQHRRALACFSRAPGIFRVPCIRMIMPQVGHRPRRRIFQRENAGRQGQQHEKHRYFESLGHFSPVYEKENTGKIPINQGKYLWNSRRGFWIRVIYNIHNY